MDVGDEVYILHPKDTQTAVAMTEQGATEAMADLPSAVQAHYTVTCHQVQP